MAELEDDALLASYLRGANLISRTTNTTEYYTFNAHGDVVNLTNASGISVKTYDYDAFGNEKDRVGSDPNPFRYCGEYFDVESGAYYLRARYYDPSVGRFTQEDTHWNASNMIYGDEPQQIGEYEDPLGTSRYVYAPQIIDIMQAGNLYNYCGHNPIYYSDFTGKEWYHWVIGGVIVVAAAVAVVATAGGALPALYAVGAVAGGSAAATASATAAAGAFIGASAAFGYELLVADCSSIENFNASGSWKTVAFTAGGLLVGGAYGVYAVSKQ